MKTITTIIIFTFLFCLGVAELNSANASETTQEYSQNNLLLSQNDTGRSLGALRKKQQEVASNKKANIEGPQTASYYQQLRNWIYKTQATVTRELSSHLQNLKDTNDMTFALYLVVASFIYGLVHAAGPGHGKVVVTSYVMANHQTMRRGVTLAFLSAFVQGTVAIVLVSVLALIVGATGSTIKSAGALLTQLSYVMIITLGVYLLYKTLQSMFTKTAYLKSDSEHQHHSSDEACGCGHKHIPDANEVEGDWSFSKVTALILSVGLRPCTGAIFVLVFAVLKGLFWAGAVAVYAMALGTAITISLVTISAVTGRELALFTVSGKSKATRTIYDLCAIGGAFVIIIFGAVLLSTTFSPMRPF